MSVEVRVSKVEDGLGRLSSEVRVQGHDIAALKTDVGKIGAGVERLLEHDARRPEALTWKAIAAVCGAAVTIALVGHWLIAQAPAVQELGRRLDRLDDAEVGRVPRIERHLEAAAPGWGTLKITRSK